LWGVSDGALEPLSEPAAAAVSERLQAVDELAGAFLLSKREPTRSAYRRDLTDFATFLAATGVAPLAVRRVHVDAYARMLERHGAAPTTIARRLACLAGFYAYALAEELIDRNPVEHVDRPHVGEDSQTLGPDRDQARGLLRAADQACARDRALAYLLAHLGLRVSEALRLTAGDVTTTRGHRTVWVTRKRGRRQQLALSPACAQALDALLAQRPDGALFVTRTGRPLDRHHAAKVIARLGRRAGLAYPLTPHGLRHAFITLALDAGASLRDVQDAAGHADPRTTRRYDRARGNLDRSPSYDVARHLAN
jgi:site-specific recombinase XerD